MTRMQHFSQPDSQRRSTEKNFLKKDFNRFRCNWGNFFPCSLFGTELSGLHTPPADAVMMLYERQKEWLLFAISLTFGAGGAWGALSFTSVSSLMEFSAQIMPGCTFHCALKSEKKIEKL